MKLGVIFDMDGVLVASGPAHAASWKMVARKHGRTVTDEDFRRNFGRPSRDIIRILWGEDGPGGPRLSEEQVRRIDDEKEAAYRELVRGMVPLTIGTREALAALYAAGIALAVGTSGPPENVELVLTETQLEHYFRAVVTGADITRGKPAPDCFALAAERLGLAAADCVVVEDAPVGLEAARAAGMGTIALVGTYDADSLRAAGATEVVTELTAVTPALVQKVCRHALRG